MDEQIDTQEVVTAEETTETTEEVATEAPKETTEAPKEEKPKETLEQKEARLQRELKQTQKKLGKDVEPKAKTDVLDDTALDYLDLKGVSEAEDIEVVEKIMEKTGMSAREALKDEYVVAKLKANKETRELKAATPSNTKRAGDSTDDVSAALAKFKANGTLPDNFELRSKVLDAIEAGTNPNKPSWHK